MSMVCVRRGCNGTRFVPTWKLWEYTPCAFLWWRWLARRHVGDLARCTTCGTTVEITADGVRSPHPDSLPGTPARAAARGPDATAEEQAARRNQDDEARQRLEELEGRRTNMMSDALVTLGRVGLPALLATFLLVTSARAVTFYVSPTGTAAAPGTPGAPCALSTANYAADAGDVILMAAGNYTTSIRPVRGGDIDHGKIRYSGNVTGGDSVLVSGGINLGNYPYITVSNLTAHGLSTYAGVTIAAAHDSLDNVHMWDGLPQVTLGGDYFRIIDCTFYSDTLDVCQFGAVNSTLPPSSLLLGGIISNTTITATHTGHDDWHYDGGMMMFGSVDGLEVTNSTFNITVSPNGEYGVFKFYGTSNTRWTDCVLNLTSYATFTSATCDECNSVRLRNGSHDNRFLRCSYRFNGTKRWQFLASSSGDVTMNSSNRNNTWRECDFRASAPFAEPLLYFQDGMQRDTVAYCTVVSAYAVPFGINQSVGVDSSVVMHNTFIKTSPDTILAEDADPWTGCANAHLINNENWTGTLKFYDNILYAVDVHADSLHLVPGGAAFLSESNISAHRWNGDYNLWSGENGPDSLITVGGAWTDTTTLRGYSAAGAVVETHSRFGAPLFLGGTPTPAGVLTFDARLSSASPAIGGGSGGSDIGALAFSSIESDTFEVTYSAGGIGGSISGDSSQSIPFDSCGTLVEAVEDDHYHFVSWSDGNLATMRTDCDPVADVEYVAYFGIDTVTVQYVAGTGGTIYLPANATQRKPYAGYTNPVVALPSTGYHFLRWLPDSSTVAARTDSVYGDTTITATFAPNYYQALYGWGPNGSLDCVDCVSQPGDTVLLQSVVHGGSAGAVAVLPDAGYSFLRWTDGSTDSVRVDTNMTEDIQVWALFARKTYTLAYTAGTGGTISGTATQTVYHGTHGSAVTAVASYGYEFYKWSDSTATATRSESSVTASASYSAIFRYIGSPAGVAGISLSGPSTVAGTRYTLTVSSTGTGELHVYSVKLYHLLSGMKREVSCTVSPASFDLSTGSSRAVTFSSIRWRWRYWPHYRIVVVSDAGTATYNLTYDPC